MYRFVTLSIRITITSISFNPAKKIYQNGQKSLSKNFSKFHSSTLVFQTYSKRDIINNCKIENEIDYE